MGFNPTPLAYVLVLVWDSRMECDKAVYAFNRNAINRIRLYQFSNANIDNLKLLIILKSSKKLLQ